MYRKTVRKLRARLLVTPLEERAVPALYTVQNLNDSGTNSLRDCIAKANAAGGADTINFAAGLSGTIFLSTNDPTYFTDRLAITGALMINGPGANVLTIHGNNANRVFRTINAPTGAAISISGLTISGGNITGSGGALLMGSQSVTINDCVITGNQASKVGGAIFVDGNGPPSSILIVNNSTLSGNTAGYNGGAIYGYLSASVTCVNSTLSGNAITTISGGSGGGAVCLTSVSASQTALFRQCTISGNSASTSGGGIMFVNSANALTIDNCTIVNNSTGVGSGGGLYIANPTLVPAITSSIVSGNVASTGNDISASKTLAVNFSAIGSSAGFTFTGGNNLAFGTNLLLGALANSGGPNKTHALQAGSPLLDKGSNPAGLTYDQRGLGFVRTKGTIDIGAVEDQHAFVVSNTNDAGAGSLRQALLCANGNLGVDTITFDPNYFNITRTIGLTTGELPIGDAVTLVGPGPGVATVHGNNNSRVFNTSSAAAGSTIAISGLTITGGKTAYDGGGIYIGDESVTLSNCSITANLAGEDGGGINVQSAGAATKASLVITDSTISGNTAIDAGGGIYIYNSGSLTCTNSTIANNKANGVGGGIYFDGTVTAGGLTIRSTTISTNTGTGGGGIGLVNFTGSANVLNSTITANLSNNSKGGGIARLNGPGTINIESTIISGNINAAAPDISSTGMVNVNYSALGSLTGVTPTGANNLTVGVDLKLGSLANNGGTSLTYLPGARSPLIDAGSNVDGLGADQRGPAWVRSFGQTDIGAVEVQNSFVVTNTNNSGTGSLRQILAVTDSNPGPDTITFDSSVFTSLKTINVATGELSINESVSILAPMTGVSLNANQLSRVLNTSDASTDAAIVLENIALISGKVTGDGGAFYIGDEDVTIKAGLVIASNATGNGGGVAIAQTAGSLTLGDSMVQACTATGDGGGIYAPQASTITIRRSSLRFLTATGSGGGVFFGNGGSLSVEDSTLSGNTANELVAALGGGAVYFSGAAAKFMFSNSTLSGNKATTASAGAVNLRSFTGTAEFRNCTITANSSGANGGGIARTSGTGGVMLSSSIVAGNTNAATPDMSFNASTTITGNSSLVGVADVGLFNFGGSGVLIGTKASPLDAKLGALANNGGPTQTHALLSGSPAVNAGNNGYSLTNDQRGVGFQRIDGSAVDIGAFEFPTPPSVSSVVANDGSAQRSRVTSIKVTFDQPVFIPGPAAFELKRQSDSALVGINVTPLGATGEVTITFTGAATNYGSLADGRYTLRVLNSQVSNANGNLDGDGNGSAGDDFVLVGDTSNKLFRLFGDADGNGTVNGADFLAFRLAFLSNNATFDFDGDGQVAGVDFLQFRLRFLQTI